MNSRNNRPLLNLLLGAGAYVLDSMRGRLSGPVDDLRSRAQGTFETASQRFRRASDAIRGEDSHWVTVGAAGILGLGVGVCVGLLLAPASGAETRNQIAGKALDIRDRISSREGSTGFDAA